MNVLDLFSGIGGFSLGLERAGMRTKAFCEIDPYCRAVLRRHWPDVPVYDDVRTLTAARLTADGIIASIDWNTDSLTEGSNWTLDEGASAQPQRTGIDLICGGFPCQDISTAGKGAGIGGERSGLWSEYARIVGEVRPKYVLVENVAALLGRGLATVLGDLAALGYDAEWHCIPAAAVGAPHRRDRVWIVAYAARNNVARRGYSSTDQPDTERKVQNASDVAYAGCKHFDIQQWLQWFQKSSGNGSAGGAWLAEPDVGRVAHGVSARVDRLRALGNAVVPQIPEIIGRAIMSALP